MDIQHSKAILRQHISSLSLSCPKKEAAIKAHAVNLLKMLSPRVVGLFHPLKNEPNILDIAHQDIICALPKIRHNSMIYTKYEHNSAIMTSALGTIETKSQIPISPEVFFIPGVAFDQNGYRLGRGKGFFDMFIQKAIAKRSDLVFIGVCFDEQLMDALPIEAHDQRVNYIITNKEVIDVNGT